MSAKNPENDQPKKYKSPLRKLVTFFEESRNQWKEKHKASKQTVKQLSNRVRYLESSKEQWKQKAKSFESKLRALKVETRDSAAKKKCSRIKFFEKKLYPRMETVETKISTEVPESFQVVPFQHQYSIGCMMLYLSLVLSASTSLRGASRALAVVFSSFQLPLSVPTWHSGRLWLLRVGYYKLTRPKPVANDWVWIVDHTIQLGAEKCLVILGLRLNNLPPKGKCLKHEDLEPITLYPVTHSDGTVVYEQLEAAAEKTGVPRAIVGDCGSELKAGIKRFCQAHPKTDYIHDIKHKTALLLKHELQSNPIWNQFTNNAATTKLELQQTPLAFLSPPNQRSKSRYMNVEILVQWGQKTLTFMNRAPELGKAREKLGWLFDYRDSLQEWGEIMQVIGVVESFVRNEGYFLGSYQELKQLLPHCHSEAPIKISNQMLDFVAIQESKVKPGERLVGSSEVIESVLGKQKYLEHEQSKSGFTGLLLGIAAMLGTVTTTIVSDAMEKVSTAQVLDWCKTHFGPTLQGRRKAAFVTPKSE